MASRRGTRSQVDPEDRVRTSSQRKPRMKKADKLVQFQVADRYEMKGRAKTIRGVFSDLAKLMSKVYALEKGESLALAGSKLNRPLMRKYVSYFANYLEDALQGYWEAARKKPREKVTIQDLKSSYRPVFFGKALQSFFMNNVSEFGGIRGIDGDNLIDALSDTFKRDHITSHVMLLRLLPLHAKALDSTENESDSIYLDSININNIRMSPAMQKAFDGNIPAMSMPTATGTLVDNNTDINVLEAINTRAKRQGKKLINPDNFIGSQFNIKVLAVDSIAYKDALSKSQKEDIIRDFETVSRASEDWAKALAQQTKERTAAQKKRRESTQPKKEKAPRNARGTSRGNAAANDAAAKKRARDLKKSSRSRS